MYHDSAEVKASLGSIFLTAPVSTNLQIAAQYSSARRGSRAKCLSRPLRLGRTASLGALSGGTSPFLSRGVAYLRMPATCTRLVFASRSSSASLSCFDLITDLLVWYGSMSIFQSFSTFCISSVIWGEILVKRHCWVFGAHWVMCAGP